MSEILNKAIKRALGGGTAGAIAMGLNVVTLMWLRTTINYQYRNGTGTLESFRTLWKDGGVPRFYRGLIPALAQGPLSRFGDTAANAGMLHFLDHFEQTKNLSVGIKTGAASGTAALWRIFLMPIDTMKTTMQVHGSEGFRNLLKKAKTSGPSVFYHGAMAAFTASFAGHYPWFFTYNTLQEVLPKYEEIKLKLMRNAFIGFCSSVVSDTVSNSIRVVKVYRQTATEVISYPEAVKQVIQQDGVLSLFGRGLKTKIFANGLQGLMFSVLWKLIDEKLFQKK
jgi:hypothetical protein